jgi:adenosylcobinamide amidohydrolase
VTGATGETGETGETGVTGATGGIDATGAIGGIDATGTSGAGSPASWCTLRHRVEGGQAWPVLAWEAGPGWQMLSSGVLGGGIGPRRWWLNAEVPLDYPRLDPDAHLTGIAAELGLDGPGVGMLTAAKVTRWRDAADGGVRVAATVGLGVPVLAAAPPERHIPRDRAAGWPRRGDRVPRVGTINVLAVLPVPLTPAALVNAVITATEAKTQALAGAGIPGTGTASDAVCVACPDPGGGASEPFGGPRSPWGARLARAVHAAVAAGTADWVHRRGVPPTAGP